MAPSGGGVYGTVLAKVLAKSALTPSCPSRRLGVGRGGISEQDLQVLSEGLRARMLVAESGTRNAQRPLVLRPRAGQVTLHPQHAAEIVEADGHIRMLRAQRRLINPQCSFVQRSRPRVVAEIPQHVAEIVGIRADIGVVRAVCCLINP